MDWFWPAALGLGTCERLELRPQPVEGLSRESVEAMDVVSKKFILLSCLCGAWPCVMLIYREDAETSADTFIF